MDKLDRAGDLLTKHLRGGALVSDASRRHLGDVGAGLAAESGLAGCESA